MTDRVLIIAPHGSYRTFPFIEAAEKMGVEVLIASEGKHSIVSAYAHGLHIDCTEQDQALRSEVMANPLISRTLVSKRGNVTAILVNLENTLIHYLREYRYCTLQQINIS